MDIDQWVRANKKRLARELVEKIGGARQPQPTAIFTAGLPGSGKTEFTSELLSELSVRPIRIDMDELAEKIDGYRPQIADAFRKGASSILTELYTKILREGLDFVFDGTLAHERALLNVERALKRGYAVKIYYIHQDPIVAWQFTKDRELVEKRGIQKPGFIRTYETLYENLRKLQKNKGPVVLSIVIKDADNSVLSKFENVTNVFAYTGPLLSPEALARVIIE